MSKKKFEKLIRKMGQSNMLHKEPDFKIKYNHAVIHTTVDYSLKTELGDILFIVNKVTEAQIDLITKHYIFANKIFDEKELAQKTMIVIGDNKSEFFLKQLSEHLGFANNFLFHNSGIKFRVMTIEEFQNKVHQSKSEKEFIKNLIE